MNPASLTTGEAIKARFRKVIPWAGLFGVYYLVGLFIPPGLDWVEVFSLGENHPIWTPWTNVVLRLINFHYPLLIAITLTAITLRCYRYKRSPYIVFLCLFSFPMIWILLLGNLEGLVLVGLLALPWGVPFVLMKPQLASFALLANRRNLLAGVVWVAVSLVIWGWWPARFLTVLTPEWSQEWVQDISLFPWGILVALPLLWLSRGDEDLLMAAGSFATPHLFFYHFILLMPSLARMDPRWRVLTWVVSWLPISGVWLGHYGWRFGNLLGLFFWLGLYFSTRCKKPIPSDTLVVDISPAS